MKDDYSIDVQRVYTFEQREYVSIYTRIVSKWVYIVDEDIMYMVRSSLMMWRVVLS